MNHLSSFFNTTIAAVIFAMLLFPYYLLRKWKSRASKGIPAPQPQAAWPFDPPHITLAALANTYGPLFSISLEIQFVPVVSCSKVAKELFTGANDVIVTFRPALVAGKLMGYNYASFLFTPGGLYWRETRKISTLELLSNRRLELLKHIRNQEVKTSTKDLYEALLRCSSGQEGGNSNARRLIKSVAIDEREFMCVTNNAYITLSIL